MLSVQEIVLCEVRAASLSVTDMKACPRDPGVDPGDWRFMLYRGNGKVFAYDTSVRSLGVVPPMLHIHFSAAIIGRTSILSLKSSNKAIDFLQTRRTKKKGNLILRKIYRFRRRYITSKLIKLRSVLFI